MNILCDEQCVVFFPGIYCPKNGIKQPGRGSMCRTCFCCDDNTAEKDKTRVASPTTLRSRCVMASVKGPNTLTYLGGITTSAMYDK